MTNRELILEQLRGGAVSKRDLMRVLFYTANPDTIARTCRQMEEDGEIVKVKADYTTYKLNNGRLL